MDRTITVRGTGRVIARPDQVEITLTLTAEQKEYDAAMDMAAEQLEGLQDALRAEGFEKDALKTTNFNVSTRYDFHHDERGNTTRVFLGYDCTQGLRLTFPFDTARLGRVLSAVSGCTAEPELNIRFTVADPAALSDELLRSAAVGARQKAEVLAAASGAHLGELVRVYYTWEDRDFAAPTVMAAAGVRPRAKAAVMDFTPEDIDLTDQVTFTWELL